MHSLKTIHILGAIFTIIAGTILHFVWEWSGYNNFVAIFSPVNESTWEHLKLLFFPFAIFTIIEYFIYGKNIGNFFKTKTKSVLLGMLSIIIIFYTYTGILGKNYLALDIATFIISVIITYLYSYHQLSKQTRVHSAFSDTLAVINMMIIAAAFAFFTFYPPTLGLFISPV